MVNLKSFEPKALSPLDSYKAIVNYNYQQQERPFVGKFIIRGNDDNQDFLAITQEILSTSLPLIANTTCCFEQNTALWLGPNEWLVWTTDIDCALILALQKKLGTINESAVINLSDYYTIIEVGGDLARLVLSHGCPLDLSADKFKAGQCAQSIFRQANILVYQSNEKPTYHLQVRWSFACYLWQYLKSVYESER